MKTLLQKCKKVKFIGQKSEIDFDFLPCVFLASRLRKILYQICKVRTNKQNFRSRVVLELHVEVQILHVYGRIRFVLRSWTGPQMCVRLRRSTFLRRCVFVRHLEIVFVFEFELFKVRGRFFFVAGSRADANRSSVE